LAEIYSASPELIEQAMTALRERGVVAEDATFNPGAPGGLRREVAYRDADFLRILAGDCEREIADEALAYLKRRNLLRADATFSHDGCDALRSVVRERFRKSWTSLSPVSERLLFMLASAKRPRNVFAAGVFWGYTLAWTAGASCGPSKVYDAERIVGMEPRAEFADMARGNFGMLAGSGHVEILAEDATKTAQRLQGPFDYVYLDADAPEDGKRVYLRILKELYPKLEPGAWVLAHDTTDPGFLDDLGDYLTFVRDPTRFSQSISFDVDDCGLELSVR
jgi:predicted O-methyltransferase YrrM